MYFILLVTIIIVNWKKARGITDDCLQAAIAIPLFTDLLLWVLVLNVRRKFPIFLFSHFYAGPMTNSSVNFITVNIFLFWLSFVILHLLMILLIFIVLYHCNHRMSIADR